MAFLFNGSNHGANLDYFKALLDSGDFPLDFQEPDKGRTALIVALELDREDLALEFIRRGANLELVDAMGKSALMYACLRKYMSAVKEMAKQVSDLKMICFCETGLAFPNNQQIILSRNWLKQQI
jgi:ankyrin repeat protein